MSLKIFKNKYVFLVLLASFFMRAQELPPIQNYSSKEYGAENQNWAISQSDEKYIYVANNSGLLEFNGAKWRLYPSPKNTIIRSVNCVNDIIYTGSYMEFGYWKKNEFGSLDYTSISNQLQEPLIEEDFWNIVSVDNWVLFQSLHRIYIYNTEDESFRIINSKTQLPKVFLVDGGIYFQKLNEGVFKIENGSPILISDNDVLKSNILVNIFKMDGKILLQTQLNGFYYLDDNKGFKKWKIAADEIISKISVYSSLLLGNGSLVFGTISNGIYQIDSKGNLLTHINRQNGLNNNTVLSMYEDVDQNLWLGLDNGISVVNFNDEFLLYNDIYGGLGSVYAAVSFNEYLYLGTNQGLFYKKLESDDDFKFIDGTDGQVWCLKIFDNTLFCGHNKGTFVVDNGIATLITDAMGTMEIKSIKNHENLLIQGSYSGLNLLEKVNNNWQLRNKVKGFSATPRFIEFTKNGSVLVGHEYKGVFKLKLNDDFTKVLNYEILENTPKSPKSTISSYNEEIFYVSDKGIFKYNNINEKFEQDSILTREFFEDDKYISGKLVVDEKTNSLWGFTDRGIIYFSQGKLNDELESTKIYLPASSRRDIVGYESVLNLRNQKYLFGSSDGYVILDLKKIKNVDFEVEINTIEKSVIGEEPIAVSLSNNKEFKNKQNNISFNFSVPNFNKYSEVYYQYQLTNIYNQWSGWSKDSEIEYKNLPYGKYSFKVKARIGNKLSTNVAVFSFIVEKPWYLSNEMLLLYIVLMVALLFLVHFLYKRYYTRQKRQLITKKQNEFTLAQLENEKTIMNLTNEKLKQEVDSKTRELASSTLSIVKNNEILNTIKEELSGVKDDSKVKSIIKIINKNLSNTGDWEMFQDAFNNADSDFLKRIKNIHPALTPNDLRLCAYLRLNLSSKEIAPLLNISVRSVEIKRYRLRKKMDLPHEKGLVEYVLEL